MLRFMKTIGLAAALAAAGAAAWNGPIAAAEAGNAAPAAQLSSQDRADIGRIEAYLNDITTVRSGFLQVAPDGSVAQGTLYVSRPGKMRVEYDPPVQMLMVATGIWFIYYDGELGETTYLPQRSTPLSLLLKEEIRLDRDAEVLGVERQPGVIRLALAGTEETGGAEGVLVLTFSDRPLALRQWVLRDPQGQATKLALLDPQFGVNIPPERFMYVSPAPAEPQTTR